MREADLAMFRRYVLDPDLMGTDWHGFQDARQPAKRFELDGYLGEDGGRLIVDVDGVAAGSVGWRKQTYNPPSYYWEIGIVLLPEWRGKGLGWRAQAMLCDYLFEHTPVQRIEAGTQPENVAEQRALEKAGFQLEGVVRACEFRAGQWRDGLLYGRLRDDPRVNPQ